MLLRKRLEYHMELLPYGGQRIDFVVEDEIILELKSVSELNKIHKAQMISYLKAANKRLGLIFNFAKKKLDVVKVVNNF